MANSNNITNFTAADIEKYHRGLLSNKERHELEKAAMDDPFLADALEGYALPGVKIADDINELKRRLAQKTEARVIPLKTASNSNFKLLRAAVVLAFVAGSGLLIYQFGFNNKKEEIAQTGNTKKETIRPTNTSTGTASTQLNDSSTMAGLTTSPVAGPGKETAVPKSTNDKGTGIVSTNTSQPDEYSVVTAKPVEDAKVNNIPAAPIVTTTAPANPGAVRNDDYYKEAEKKDQTELAKLKSRRMEADKQVAINQTAQQNNDAVLNNRSAEQNNGIQRNQSTLVFRGRVTDAENNGVPFANVTNIEDNNAGTYTDVKGNFILTYPDSVLTVQVRSVGFENTNVQLRNSLPTNKIVLQDDHKNLNEVVVSNQTPNAANRNRDANRKIEQPEPADGWENYNAYIANNVELPQDIKDKKAMSGEVQLSFEVDKDGDPTNIKIVKSLCTKCDKEAIRLVKEGPKWKRNAKNGRTTVTISF